MPHIQTRHLSLSRAGQAVLKNIGFQVNAGEIFMLTGPSGSGKSTLLHCLNRLLEPPPETIFLEGADITGLDVLNLRRRMGMVFQQAAMFPGTVADNVGHGPRLLNEELSAERIQALLESVTLDAAIAKKDASQLSGGQAQRVALARTLALKPDVLLLDEPTSSLDPVATRQIEKTLFGLRDKFGLTLIWVSHDIEQVRRVGERVLLLNQGEIVDCGTVDNLLDPDGKHAAMLAFAAGEADHKDGHF